MTRPLGPHLLGSEKAVDTAAAPEVEHGLPVAERGDFGVMFSHGLLRIFRGLRAHLSAPPTVKTSPVQKGRRPLRPCAHQDIRHLRGLVESFAKRDVLRRDVEKLGAAREEWAKP